jgi:dipeptide/tripeptide permease
MTADKCDCIDGLIGSLISYTVIAYLCQNVSFAIGYSLPVACMSIAIAAFWFGRHRYKVRITHSNNHCEVECSKNDDATVEISTNRVRIESICRYSMASIME